MNNLPLPLPQIKPKSIFRECVDGYRDKSKHRKLLSYEARVEDDSDNYAELIIESSSAPRLPSIPDADRKQLMALYEEKFVGDPGRKYYNQILGQAPYGLCPLCGVSQASTLDHFLPKSKYPTLSVTPANLIPSCRDCNMKKSSNVTLPVHLYYDIIPDDIWLYVSLKQELAPVYSVKCPDNWNARLAQRVKTHFKVYELGKLYSAHAAQEIAGKTPC